MSALTSASAGRQARSAASRAANNPWVDRAARIGIASRGAVFVVLGYLIARIALGALGKGGTKKSASGPGVADAIAAQPGGRVALVVLAVGLVLFAAYSLVEAARVSESSTVKRWGSRFRALFQAALYAAFGVSAFLKAISAGGSSGSSAHSDRQQEQWSARVLRWPAGWLWLGLLGVVLVIIAGYQLKQCVKRGFFDDLKTWEMTPRTHRWTSVTGAVGHAGRAGAFGLVAYFVFQAAVENDPNKGKGVDGSARMLANSAGGPVLLWLLAIGVAVFGLYLFFFESRFRKV